MNPENNHYMTLIMSVIFGTSLGACLFLYAKINQPIHPMLLMDTEFEEFIDQPIPHIELKSTEGDIISTSQLKGTPYVLFFGSATCEACDFVYPMIKEAAQDVSVIMIVPSSVGLKKKIEDEGLTIPVVKDSMQVSMKSLKVTGFPTTIFVNAKGKILKAASGDLFSESIMRYALAYVKNNKSDKLN